MDRKKGQAIAFYIGDRSQKGAQKIWDNLTSFYKENNRFYIDDWDAYKTVFPTKKYISSKIKKDTNHIERTCPETSGLNLIIRNWYSRLVYMSLLFSKK